MTGIAVGLTECLLCPRPRAKDYANNPKETLPSLLAVDCGVSGVGVSMEFVACQRPHGSRPSLTSTSTPTMTPT